MDINIKLTIDSAGLERAITLLAEAIAAATPKTEKTSLSEPSAESVKAPEAPAAPDPQPPKPDTVKPSITMVELRAQASAAAKAGKSDDIKALLKVFGVPAISKLPDDKLDSFAEAMAPLMAGVA